MSSLADRLVRTESTQRQSSTVETNATAEPTTAPNLNRSSSMIAAASATQLLLQQLGIARRKYR